MSEDVFQNALDKIYGPGGPSVDDDTIKHEAAYYLARAEAEIERLTAENSRLKSRMDNIDKTLRIASYNMEARRYQFDDKAYERMIASASGTESPK